MFCLYCGNSLPDNVMFCNRCGKRQDASGNQVPPVSPFPIIPESPSQLPTGNVPMVQGTPQSGPVPSRQRMPPTGGGYPAGRRVYSDAASPGSQPSVPLQAPYPASQSLSTHFAPPTSATQYPSTISQQAITQPPSQRHTSSKATVEPDRQIPAGNPGIPRRTFLKIAVGTGVVAAVAGGAVAGLHYAGLLPLEGRSTAPNIPLVDKEPGTTLEVFRGHTAAVNAVAFSPDGKYIASGGADNKVRVWNSQTGETISTYANFSDAITSIAFYPTERTTMTIAAASIDGSVQLFEASPGVAATLGSYIPTGGGPAMRSVVFSSDISAGSRIIAFGGDDGIVHVWDSATSLSDASAVPYEGLGNNPHVAALSFSPDGNYLAVAWDYGLTVLEITTDRVSGVTTANPTAVYSSDDPTITSIAFSPNGKYIVTGNGDTGETKFWDFANRNPRPINGFHDTHTDTNGQHNEFIFTVAYSPRGNSVASGGWNGVRVRDLAGNMIVNYTKHSDDVYSVAFSPDGKMIASASKDKTVQVWTV